MKRILENLFDWLSSRKAKVLLFYAAIFAPSIFSPNPSNQQQNENENPLNDGESYWRNHNPVIIPPEPSLSSHGNLQSGFLGNIIENVGECINPDTAKGFCVTLSEDELVKIPETPQIPFANPYGKPISTNNDLPFFVPDVFIPDVNFQVAEKSNNTSSSLSEKAQLANNQIVKNLNAGEIVSQRARINVTSRKEKASKSRVTQAKRRSLKRLFIEDVIILTAALIIILVIGILYVILR